MSRPTKFDYDSQEFYDSVMTLATQGLTDAEIAWALEDKYGNGLTPEVFCKMKRGKYEAWTKEENNKRSRRLSQVLARGRAKINSVVRGAFLKAALGGKKVTSAVVPKVVKVECACGGEDETCEVCGGRGYIYVKTQETVTELPPSMQALSTWLYHRDEEYRMIERKLDESADDIPQDIDKGISIDSWIKDKVGGEADAES